MKKSLLPFSQKWHLPLIILSALIAYLNTLHHGFVLDDVAVIERNEFVKKGFGGIAQILKTFYWQGYWNSNSGLYRPLSLITFAIEWQLSPSNPMIHHLFNIAYYVIVCCLIYRLLLKWFPDFCAEILLLIVLLFVVHPIHTEVVANIKSRDELLALLFFLLSATTFTVGSTRSIILSSFYFFLALLSKEGIILLLPLLLIHIQISRKATIAEVFKSGIPFFTISIAWLLLHWCVIGSGTQVITYTYNDNAILAANSFMDQKGTALGIMVRYFVKLIYPYEMAYDYSFSQIPITGFFSLLSLTGLTMLSAFVYLFLKFYKRDPFISISIGFILFPLLLTSNLFFTIGATAADRFLFVSSIGSCMLMVYLPYKFLKPANHPVVLKWGTFTVFLIFITMTLGRNKAWKNNFTLFEHDVNVVKNSARAHYNYGTGLMELAKENTDQRLSKAKQELEKSLEIDPNYYDALINLAAVHGRLKSYPASIDLYRRAININKNNKDVYGNIGESFFRNDQPDSAVVYLRKAHSLFNNDSETYNFEGTSLFKLQKYEEACKAFEAGIEKDSSSFSIYLNYGNALAMSNHDREAIKAFEKSYSLKPDNSQALYFIAITYNKMGDSTNANKYYRAFKKLNP
jgi:tetratricopeptide (TPR) repeat protein